MKKFMLGAAALAAFTAGCFTCPQDARTSISYKPVPIAGTLPRGPITADQVEAANAHKAAEAVWDEMDRDQQKDQFSAAVKDTKKR